MAEVSHRTRRRIFFRILPYVFLLYIINFIDRMNVSAAALEMPFDKEVLGIGSGIFFIGYFALNIPGALIVEKSSARKLICAIMVLWGLVTMMTAFVRTPTQFYVVRFLLGFAEAGFFPGIVVYLTHWFPNEDRAKAAAYFMAAIPVSSVLGAPLAGWLLGVRWFGLEGWHWLFILEGIPAVIFGIVTLFYLTDWPHEAKWLKTEEREWLVNQLEHEKQAKLKVRKYGVFEVFYQREVLTLTAVYFLFGMLVYGIGVWLPTIVKGVSGESNLNVMLLSAIPYAVSTVVMQINGWHSDKTNERLWHTAIPLMLAGVWLSVMYTAELSTVAMMTVLVLLTASYQAILPTFWAIPSTILGEAAGASATGFINSIGMLGGFFGPALMGYITQNSHTFKPAYAMLAVCMFVAGLLVLSTRIRKPEAT